MSNPEYHEPTLAEQFLTLVWIMLSSLFVTGALIAIGMRLV